MTLGKKPQIIRKITWVIETGWEQLLSLRASEELAFPETVTSPRTRGSLGGRWDIDACPHLNRIGNIV